MILKKENYKFSVKWKFILCTFCLFFLFGTGIIVQKFGLIGNVLLPQIFEFIELEKREIRGFTSNFNLETLKIEIPFENFKKIESFRKKALERNHILQNEKIYLNGELSNKLETFSIKIRLKGDDISHMQNYLKWSYRIKIRGDDTFLGMKQFSIHHPKERVFLNEWLFHKTVKKEGLISIKYSFVKVILNGQDLGIYALEEHFDNELLEKNQKKPGVIIKFDETYLWEEMMQYSDWTFRPLMESAKQSGYGSYMSRQIESFKQNSVLKDSIFKDQYIKAITLLNDFRDGKEPTSKIFDIEKLSTFFALSELFGASHAIYMHNLRFYFNPISNLLEPIPFDAHPQISISILPHLHNIRDNQKYQEWTNYFMDPVFYELYIKKVIKYCSGNFLESLLIGFKEDIEKNKKILSIEWPNQDYSLSFLENNRQYINELFEPKRSITTSLVDISSDTITLSIGNIQILPLTNFHLSLNNKTYLPLEKEIVLQGKNFNQVISYKKITFDLSSFNQKIELDSLSISYNILGSEKRIHEVVSTVNPIQGKRKYIDHTRMPSNYSDFSFISTSNDSEFIYFKSGNHILKENLYFPEGKKIIFYKGTSINIIDSSIIFSKSPFYINGTEENPIKLFSSDSSSEGLMIMGSPEKSMFKYVTFSNFAFQSDLSWGKSGAITFYKSPVIFQNCTFFNNHSEDALNIIETKFEIHNSIFSKNNFDAFDSDFSTGEIINTSIHHSGNDGLDFSGSSIELDNVFISNIKDKAISIGEKSIVKAKDVKISKSNFGLVSKDKSSIIIDNINIDNTNIAMAVFQKKSEFGSSKIEAMNVNIQTCKEKFWVEKGSELIINNEIIEPNRKNVKSILYGEN